MNKEIKKRVEQTLYDYQIMRVSVLQAESYYDGITTQLDGMPKPKNKFHSKTETIAYKMLENKSLLSLIEKALDFLTDNEKNVIVTTYFKHNEDDYSSIKMPSLCYMSYQTYRKYKNSGLRKISVFLNYKNEEDY